MAQLVAMTGDKAIDEMLATMEARLQRKALRKGTRAGAKVVMATAKTRVPVRTGNLLRTMKVRSAKKDSTSRIKLTRKDIGHSVQHVAPKGERGRGTLDPFYAFFVEYGTENFDARRYLRSSLYDNRRQVNAANLEAIRKALPEIARTGRRAA